MTIAQLKFTRQPVIATQDCSTALITDLNGNAPIPGAYLLDGPMVWTSNDGGGVVSLTSTPGSITACAVAVGAASVTCTTYEAGVVVSGSAFAVVTNVGGKLQVNWTGTATLPMT